MRYDFLQLYPRGGSNVQTREIKRGSFTLHSAALSYVDADDRESGARTYLPIVGLDRWKVADPIRANQQ